MSITIRKKYCTYSIISSMILIFIILVSLLLTNHLSAEYIAVLSSVSYVVMIALWALAYRRLNFYLIFMLCTYIFYFGRYLLLFLNRTKYYEDLIRFYNLQFINTVALFILLCICVMNFVFCLFISSSSSTKEIKNKFLCRYRINEYGTKCIAWIMFIVSFTFSCYVLMVNIRNTQLFGYAYALRIYYEGYRIPRFFTTFLPGSFVVLVMVYKNKKMLWFIISVLCAYIGLYFASGSRLQAILLILTLVITYEMEFRHLKKADIIKIGIAFLAICFILVSISSIRNSIQNASSIKEIFNSIKINFAEDNFLLELVNECGFQINSIAVVMDNCPNPIQYNYGITYLKGIGQLIPNLFWSQNPFMQESTDTIFALYLNGGTYGIGSSFIAEAYYNFGYFSVLFMGFFGWLFAKYQIALDSAYQKDNNFLVRFFYLTIPTFALFYVRSDAVGLLKAVVYRCLIPCVAIIIISSLFKGKKGAGG